MTDRITPEAGHTKGQLTLRDDERYPGLHHIEGLPFEVSFWTLATDITLADSMARTNAAHRLIRCVNSFDDLLEALSALSFEIKCLLGDAPIGTIMHSAIEKADAAIARAQGTAS